MGLFVALLRGINVGGSGVIAMKDLCALCAELGFKSVRTFIQSGNLIFESKLAEAAIQSKLEKTLTARLKKQVDVMVRTPEQLRAILSDNPFPDKEGAKVGVAFLAAAPPGDLVKRVVAPAGELVRPGTREIYVYYPIGMGQSKLKLPLDGAAATVRNINTVTKLLALTEA